MLLTTCKAVTVRFNAVCIGVLQCSEVSCFMSGTVNLIFATTAFLAYIIQRSLSLCSVYEIQNNGNVSEPHFK